MAYENDLAWYDFPEDEPPPTPISKDIAEIEKFDDALVAAWLAQTTYANSAWAFDQTSGIPIEAWMQESFLRKERMALARAVFIKDNMRPLSAWEIGLSEESFTNGNKTIFRNGHWRCGGLAEAFCAEENRNGRKIIHLSIRGTEPENDSSGVKSFLKVVFGYFLWTYPRISKHADNFETLFDAALRRAEEIGADELHVSGHSLGGAAAEELCRRSKSSNVKTKCITFGSPGTGAGWLAAFSKIVRKFGVKIQGDSNLKIEENKKFMHLIHPNDPIPKAGRLLFYERYGEAFESLTFRERESRNTKESLVAKGLAAHSVKRYVQATEDYLNTALEDHFVVIEPPGLKAVRAARIKAAEIESKIAPEMTREFVEKAAEDAEEILISLEGESSLKLKMLRKAIDENKHTSAENIESGRRQRMMLARMTAS